MASSIIVAVRSALATGLATAITANGGMTDTEVSYQWKADWQRRERVWTRNARFTHAPASLRAGRNFRDEVGTFEVAILVEGVGRTAEWSATRALEIGQVVEQFIADRKNNELAVAGLQTLIVSGEGSLTEMFNDSGTLAELAYPVKYTARLT